jgi:hypothetical protein
MGSRPKRETGKFMVFSTRHISQADAKQLTQSPGLFAADEHQFWVWTGYTASSSLLPALSPTVRKLLAIAKAARCTYVRLDGDGPVYSDLPQFEW